MIKNWGGVVKKIGVLGGLWWKIGGFSGKWGFCWKNEVFVGFWSRIQGK